MCLFIQWIEPVVCCIFSYNLFEIAIGKKDVKTLIKAEN